MTRNLLHGVHKILAQIKSKLICRSRARARDVADDLAIQVPFSWITEHSPNFRTAVMLHIYYSEMAETFRDLICSIPDPCDVLISTDTEEKKSKIDEVFSYWKKGCVDVRVVPNRGRDIAPKLITFREIYKNYDLILFMHSKKTEQSDLGGKWRDEMIAQLCGSKETVKSIHFMFASDPTLGIICSRHYPPIRPYLHWRGNESCGKAIARKLGYRLNLDGVLDFPSGSFFWARPAALQPLLDLRLQAEDFPPEAGQIRGTIAHAIERLFLLSCEQAGYSWCKVGKRELLVHGERLLAVDGAEQLSAARADAHFAVSPTMITLVSSSRG